VDLDPSPVAARRAIRRLAPVARVRHDARVDARVTLDRSNSEHAHIAERLATTWIAWFATTRRDGRPQIVPVWFGWTGNAVVVFSAPATAKVGHVRRTPACSLGIETADGGNDAILIDATAEIASD
jgi:predicted pyridoxine 5'-phosphate oxidase superfamily flavin-nucleotide-binding protein